MGKLSTFERIFCDLNTTIILIIRINPIGRIKLNFKPNCKPKTILSNCKPKNHFTNCKPNFKPNCKL